MNDVFAQWQAEIAHAQSGLPYAPPTQQVQVQPSLASPTPSGMLSPPSPITPLSQQSNVTSPSLSPQVPQVYTHYVPAPDPTAIEMPGSLPAGVMLEPPPAAARPSSINVVGHTCRENVVYVLIGGS